MSSSDSPMAFRRFRVWVGFNPASSKILVWEVAMKVQFPELLLARTEIFTDTVDRPV
jgi:hypothetical protein